METEKFLCKCLSFPYCGLMIGNVVQVLALAYFNALTIAITIIVDFILLPALLIQFDTKEYSTSEYLIESNNTATKQKFDFEEN